MSASRKREKRVSQQDKKLLKEEKAKKEQQKYKKQVIAILCVFVLAAAAILIFASNFFYNKVTAVKLNGAGFSLAEYKYYYETAYNDFVSATEQQYGEYADMFLPDRSKSLKEQMYNSDPPQTWDEYLDETALKKMSNVALLNTLAEKDGFKLNEEQYTDIENEINSVRLAANYYGYSDVNQMLKQTYGKGMTEKLFREVCEKFFTAQYYERSLKDSYSFSTEELDAYYKENSARYDSVTYRLFYIAYGVVIENEEDKEKEEYKEACARAYAKAEEMASKVTDEQSFLDLTREYCTEKEQEAYSEDEFTKYTTKISELHGAYKDWLTESGRKEGDVAVRKSDFGVYVVYYINKTTCEFPTADVKYILGTLDYVPRYEYSTTEEYEAAKAKANEDAMENCKVIYDAFLKDGATSESLDAVAEEYSDGISSYRTMTQVVKGYFGNEIDEWLFSPERKQGDSTLMLGTYGAYIVYYENPSELYSRVLADDDLRQEKVDELKSGYAGDYEPVKTWVFKLI